MAMKPDPCARNAPTDEPVAAGATGLRRPETSPWRASPVSSSRLLSGSNGLIRQLRAEPTSPDKHVRHDSDGTVERQRMADPSWCTEIPVNRLPMDTPPPHHKHVQADSLTAGPCGCGGLQQGIRRSIGDGHEYAGEDQYGNQPSPVRSASSLATLTPSGIP